MADATMARFEEQQTNTLSTITLSITKSIAPKDAKTVLSLSTFNKKKHKEVGLPNPNYIVHIQSNASTYLLCYIMGRADFC